MINDTTHPVRIETKTEAGEMVTSADCRLTNDYGTTSMKSGDTAQIRRSGKDLDIVCKDPKGPDANARDISRANGGMSGNILLGGGINAVVDHNRGTADTYPTWIQLVYGKTLVFDRQSEKEGAPAPGMEPGAAPASW